MSAPPTDRLDGQTSRTPKHQSRMVVLTRALVWFILFQGGLMCVTALALLAGSIDFSSHSYLDDVLSYCGLPMALLGVGNIFASVLFFRAPDWRLPVYTILILNVLLYLAGALSYVWIPYVRKELAGLESSWYFLVAVNVLLGVVLRHPSVVSWCGRGRAPRRPPTSGFPVITDER